MDKPVFALLAIGYGQCVNRGNVAIREDETAIEARRFLLRLAATGGSAALSSEASRLAPEDWDWAIDRARQHRIFPLLRDWMGKFSPDLLDRLSESAHNGNSARHWAMKAMAQRGAAIELARRFDEAEIRYTLLKGGALALTAYPDPVLRPMRDLDILVSRADALKAYEIAMKAGFLQRADVAPHGLDDKHHLPILTGKNGVLLEVHHRLAERGWSGEADLCQHLLDNSVLAEIGGYKVRISNPVGTLLHLVAHAGLSHLFNNGPQVLADIHHLDRAHGLDWLLCRQLAEQMGLGRALELLLAVYERHTDGENPIKTDNSVPADLVDHTEQLMLQHSALEWERSLMRRH
ncbi:MAG: nucleotidyltransferase family protein, partial [Pseudomonadota bacterium]